jgi:hypothetical protein
MRSVLVTVLLLALTACHGSASGPPSSSSHPSSSHPSSSAREAPPSATPVAGTPERQNALRAWLGKNAHSVLEMTGRKIPRGVVICGVDVLGHGPGELYVWAECGDYRPGPDAAEFSGSAEAAVVRAHRIVFPRQQHLDADITRLFPPAVLRAIRFHDVHPTPTADQRLEMARHDFGGPRCDAGQLVAEQRSEGGPAAGTFYVPVVVTNEGPDCMLLAGDLVIWAGIPARSLAALDVTGAGPKVLLPRQGRLQTMVAAPVGRCFSADAGGPVPLAVSDGDASGPQLTVAGPGVPDGYLRCGGVAFLTSAGRSAGPSR